MKRILITGGSGFIGTHLSKFLIEQGHFVYCLDIKPPRFEHPNLIYIFYDIRDLKNLDISEPIDRIYNFAAVHTTPGHPTHEYYDTNISGAIEICSFASRLGISEMIFTSSISVYGPNEEQKDENSKLTPNSAYGYSKMLAENIHKKWLAGDKNRKLTIVRPAVVFGKGEGGNFTRLARMLQKGIFIYPGRKDTIKACIYVTDLIFLLEYARSSQNQFELFNGAYPQRYTLQEIIETFINNHYPKAKTLLAPKFIVIFAAKLFGIFNVFNIGVHPDRVMKLIKSTNIYPLWLDNQGFTLKEDLTSALVRWSKETNGKFD
jgi:nucleoside-diphosphate-sugar epimerase